MCDGWEDIVARYLEALLYSSVFFLFYTFSLRATQQSK